MTRVRAKFRCMNVSTGWEGYTSVQLMPVMGSKGNCEENKLFWKYTPGGECKVTFNKDAPVPFVAGQFYYLDFDLLESTDVGPGEWSMEERAEYRGDNYRVKLSQRFQETGQRSGEVWMALSVRRTFDMLGPIGSVWSLTFSDAPKPE